MHTFNLLDIEREMGQLVLSEKLPNLVRVAESVLCKYADDRGLYRVLLQQFDATQSTIKGSLTSSVDTLSIMDMLWPVYAHTNLYLMMPDKVATLLIDQCAIGLEAVN